MIPLHLTMEVIISPMFGPYPNIINSWSYITHEMQSCSHITPSSINTPIFVAYFNPSFWATHPQLHPAASSCRVLSLMNRQRNSESLRVLLHELPLWTLPYCNVGSTQVTGDTTGIIKLDNGISIEYERILMEYIILAPLGEDLITHPCWYGGWFTIGRA